VPNVVISPTGIQGPRGNTILNGTGTPTSDTGIDGDYYFDTTSYPTAVTLYGPKTAGAWPGAGVTLSGAAGTLLAANNLADLTSPAAARTNLGLGTAATQPATSFDTAGAAAAVAATIPAAAGSVTGETSYGQTASTGTAATFARGDHTHGTPALTTTVPAATHGVGTTASVGTAAAPARADHAHPMAAAGAPQPSAVGDTSSTGTAATFAASDHVHAREAFGAVTAQTTFGAASGSGSSTSPARADHTHGTPALPTASTSTAGVIRLDGTATDLQGHGAPAPGGTGLAADAGHAHPAPFWVPADNGLLAATYDPAHAGTVTSQSAASVAGRITLTKIALRQQIAWASIWFGLAGADAGSSLANCYLGVYDSAGTLKGTTADISSVLNVNPVAKAVALTSAFTATPGTYFIAMLLNGTWTTNTFTFKASGAGISVNANLTAPNLRYSNMLTGQTSLPATLNLASQTTTIIGAGWASQWYGIA
jgi:hypothetical protein